MNYYALQKISCVFSQIMEFQICPEEKVYTKTDKYSVKIST